MSNYSENVVSEEIDGITYTSTKFGTTKSLNLLSRAVAVLGEGGLSTIVGLGAGLSAQLAGNQLFAVIEHVARALRDDERLPFDLCSGLKCNKLRPAGEGPINSLSIFDAHFSGELPHLAKVLGFVAAHTFKGFTLGSP